MSPQIVIVGAGISGLVAARRLLKAGYEVTVLEKSRGYGGRMATRRNGEAVFDHGAQAYTLHTLFFRILNEKMVDLELAKPWSRGFLNGDRQMITDGYARYYWPAGMSHFGKYLALEHGEPLDVRLQHKVTQITRADDHWWVECGTGSPLRADALIVTAPLPQALQLLKTEPAIEIPQAIQTALAEIKYDPCLAVMATLDGPSGLPDPGGLANLDPMSPIRWIADNQQKGISPVPAVTIHGTPHFSRKHWKMDRQEAGQLLAEAARSFLKAEILELDTHGWRYSEPNSTWPEALLRVNQSPPLILAGDAFGRLSHQIDGAASSGMEAARAIHRHFAEE